MKQTKLASLALVVALAFSLNAGAATAKKAKKAKKAKAQTEQTAPKEEQKPAESTEKPQSAVATPAAPVAAAAPAAAPAADVVATSQAAPVTSETKIVERPSNLYWQAKLTSPNLAGTSQGFTVWNRIGPKFAFDTTGWAASVRPYFTVAPNTNNPGAELGDVEMNVHMPKAELGDGWTLAPYVRYMLPTGVKARAAKTLGNIQPRLYLEGTAGRMEFTYVLVPVLPILQSDSVDGNPLTAPGVVLSLGNSLRLSKLATIDLTVEPGVEGAPKNTVKDAAFSLNTDVGFSLEPADGVKISPYLEFDLADPKLSTTSFQTSLEVSFL